MIWFLGDTHGSLGHVVQQVLLAQKNGAAPDAVVFLGDLDCAQPLHLELAEIVGVTDIYWVFGNHDSDDSRSLNNLFSSDLAGKNLHGKVERIGGFRIAGLGGVFRSKVWAPPNAPSFPSYQAWRKDLMRKRPPKGWGIYEAGEERKHTTTIFPDVVSRLARQRADILVCHEAPECRSDGRGWQAVGDLARKMGVRWLFHGHHHDSPDYSEHFVEMGFKTYGVGYRGITSLLTDGKIEVIRLGDYDAARDFDWEVPNE